MNKRYSTLKLLAGILKVCAALSVAGGIFGGVVTLTESVATGAVIIIAGILVAVAYLAIAEAIGLLIEAHRSAKTVEREVLSAIPALIAKTERLGRLVSQQGETTGETASGAAEAR